MFWTLRESWASEESVLLESDLFDLTAARDGVNVRWRFEPIPEGENLNLDRDIELRTELRTELWTHIAVVHAPSTREPVLYVDGNESLRERSYRFGGVVTRADGGEDLQILRTPIRMMTFRVRGVLYQDLPALR